MSLMALAERAYYLFHRRGDVIALLRARLEGLSPEAKILDLGGGAGRVSLALSRTIRARFTVADVDSRALDRVQAGGALDPVLLQAGGDLPFDKGTFDAVFMVDVLHHVADHDHLMREAARCLKPRGRLLIVDFEATRRITRTFSLLARLSLRKCRFKRAEELADILRSMGLRTHTAQVDALRYLVEGDR